MKMLDKHYIRLNEQNHIIHAFSDATEQPEKDDIFQHEGGTLLVLIIDGKQATNPQLLNEHQVPLYERKGDKNVSRPIADIEADTPIQEESFDRDAFIDGLIDLAVESFNKSLSSDVS
jgi:hypothetical protein